MNRSLAFFIPALGVAAVDQLSKFWIRQNLALGQSLPPEGVIRLTHIPNQGGAFGLSASPWFLASITGVVLLSLLLFYRQISSLSLRASLGLIMGGGVGNLVDRLRQGYVTDFIDLRVWPVFNLADSAITIGSLLALYLILFRRKK